VKGYRPITGIEKDRGGIAGKYCKEKSAKSTIHDSQSECCIGGNKRSYVIKIKVRLGDRQGKYAGGGGGGEIFKN
jgi:hypothetical protein